MIQSLLIVSGCRLARNDISDDKTRAETVSTDDTEILEEVKANDTFKTFLILTSETKEAVDGIGPT